MVHKMSKVIGFHVQAFDREIGHVDDFLFDEGWGVRSLAVDTSNWIGGKWVVISTAEVEKIDSPEKRILSGLHASRLKTVRQSTLLTSS
jgi:hypothetical protein